MLRRSTTNKILAGVCGGIGKFTDINPWLFRILFMFLPGGLFIYLLMTVFIKRDNDFGPVEVIDSNSNFYQQQDMKKTNDDYKPESETKLFILLTLSIILLYLLSTLF